MRLRRITSDLDFNNKIKLFFVINRATKLINNKKNDEMIVIKKSNSKGYHIIVWSRTKGNINNLRKYLFEDWRHLAMDKLHKFGKQTLFYKKKKYIRIKGDYR